jgi:hypothetical protein
MKSQMDLVRSRHNISNSPFMVYLFEALESNAGNQIKSFLGMFSEGC